MSKRIDWDELLAVCRSGELDHAMASAFSVGDAAAMLVVSIFDNGSIDRLALLVDQRPDTAAEIVLAGVDKKGVGESSLRPLRLRKTAGPSRSVVETNHSGTAVSLQVRGQSVPSHRKSRAVSIAAVTVAVTS